MRRHRTPFALTLLLALGACGGEKPAPRPPEPPPLPATAGFVGSVRCQECHEERHETWLGTAHAYSLRAPSEEVVRGKFDGVPVESPYFTATPYMRGKDYHIRVVAKDRRPSGDHRVVHVVGRTLQQAYLTSGPRGEWRVLPICWDLLEGRWNLTASVLKDIAGGAGVAEDYDARNHVFNDGCGQCHATDYDVGFSVEEEVFRSRFLEGAVACESCHGPGSVHEAWHRGKRGTEGYGEPARLLHPKRDLDAAQVNATCGRCHYLHEWRYAIDADPRMGHEEIAVTLNFDGPGFFADGTLSGLNYEGTVQNQSPCFLEGNMSCLSCHKMHGGHRWAMRFEESDDRQCTQCHSGMEPDHSRHKDVRCVDCHMAKFLTGILREARDHTIRSPDPELTVRHGTPNACSQCHTDRDAAWARDAREKWWGPGDERIRADTDLVAALRTDAASVRTDDLIAASTRAESRLWFRLTALRNLAGRMDEEKARKAVRSLLADPSVDIRQLACMALSTNPDPDAVPDLLPRMKDPVRTVRVEAAFALARSGWRAATEDPVSDAVFAETSRMFERQKPYAETLSRAIYIADATGHVPEMHAYVATLFRLQFLPRDASDIVRRYARSLADLTHHNEAIEYYLKARELAGNSLPAILFLDSGDSLAALGRADEARHNWAVVADDERGDPDFRLLAAARLGRLTPAERDAAAARFRANPAGGELLRRMEGLGGR